jgi:hypothetical protein
MAEQQRVEDREVDPGHDAYLAVITTHAEPLRNAMVAMAAASGTAARSLSAADLATAADALEALSQDASAFDDELSAAHCPSYLRGANDQLQRALRRIRDGGQRSAAAARAENKQELVSAASEMDAANDEIEAAAQRIVGWRAGAARPTP